MDVFALVMGVTLVCVGWFLSGDFRRFLAGSYNIPAKVVSVAQAYMPSGNMLPSRRSTDSVINYGSYYPVCEYRQSGEQVRFTAIGEHVGNLYQIGDQLRLKVSRSRRAHGRICKGAQILLAVLSLSALMLLGSPAFGFFHLTMAHICLASVVLTLAFVVFLMYVRERDECDALTSVVSPANKYVLCLREPTAFSHWGVLNSDAVQRRRMFSARLFGGLLMSVGIVIVAAAGFADRWESDAAKTAAPLMGASLWGSKV